VVDVELRSPVFNEETGTIEMRNRVLVRAEGSDIQLYRPAGSPHDCIELIDIEMQVVDQATGEIISGRDDAERWARNLPHAFRAGDVIAVVTHDDDPPAALKAEPPAEALPEIPAPPAAELKAVAQ
jgi:hypothetical protein